MCLVLVLKGSLVRGKPLLESVGRQADVLLVGVCCLNLAFVDHICHQAVSIKWAFVTFAAVAPLFCQSGRIHYLFVMPGNDFSHIWHGAIANFNRVSIEVLVEL